MRVIVLGANGRLGSRVVESAVAGGHEVTALVRDPRKLHAAGIPQETLERVNVVQGDVSDTAGLAAAMRGHQAAVQAAGYIGGTYEEGAPLRRLVASAVRAAAEGLDAPKRLWVLGGAGVLDVPGRPGLMMVDVPGFPGKYRVHKDNFDLLMSAEASGLDWSFACPGPMFDAPSTSGARAGAREGVRAVVDEAPIALPGWSQLLPTAMLLPAFAAARRQLTSASYRDVAGVIVAHLEGGGPLSRKRVGFAAPESG